VLVRERDCGVPTEAVGLEMGEEGGGQRAGVVWRCGTLVRRDLVQRIASVGRGWLLKAIVVCSKTLDMRRARDRNGFKTKA
jgi:hypothetical protein